MTSHLSLFDEEARRATYKKWIFKSDKPCNANKMAEAGFIFTGSSREPDSVQCFFCGKSLDGWEATDDPWAEHFKHASYCDFAKTQKPQDSWTLNEWLQILQKYEELLLKKRAEESKNKVKKQFHALHKIMSSSKKII